MADHRNKWSDAWSVVRIPVLITFAVTLARLLGALGGLPDFLVNREAGGQGAIIGIVWLAPIFAVWFGFRHARAGRTGFGAAIRTNFVYSVGARVPVMVVMLAATLGGWGTHYDAYPPDIAGQPLMVQYLLAGVLPQVAFWMLVWTTLLGGTITWLAARLFAGRMVAARRAPAST